MRVSARSRLASPSVVVCDLEHTGEFASPMWFLLRSDAHHDAVGCDRDLEMKHLRQAVVRDALILDIGDLFDCMQGRYDKRADRSALREEYRHGPYLDRLVDVAAERYGDFADRWLLMSPGNHETSVAKHNDTNLTERLYERLRDRAPLLQRATYQGFVRLRVRQNAKRIGSLTIAYHHGYGGSAPVTRGVIQSNRMAITYPDADLVWSGHTHTDWYLSIARLRLNASDAVDRDEQVHIKSPGYKEDLLKGEGWAVEKGFMPQSLGAWWLKVWIEVRTREQGSGHRLRFSVEPAR
jgi:hypothetical protein